MTRPSRHRPITLIAISVLIATACGNAPSSPSPSPSSGPTASASPAPTTSGSAGFDAVYAEVNQQVRAIRGLEEKKPVTPTILSTEELSEVIRTTFDQDYPPAQVAADEMLYKGLGLITQDADLEAIFVDLLESQVAGLYDPAAEKLYVVSKEGGVGPGRAGLLLARVRPRPAGSALRPGGRHRWARGPVRPTPRPPVARRR